MGQDEEEKKEKEKKKDQRKQPNKFFGNPPVQCLFPESPVNDEAYAGSKKLLQPSPEPSPKPSRKPRRDRKRKPGPGLAPAPVPRRKAGEPSQSARRLLSCAGRSNKLLEPLGHSLLVEYSWLSVAYCTLA